MFLFGWLVVVALLILLAEFVLLGRSSLVNLRRERRMRSSPPSHRAVAALTMVLLIALILWGFFGKDMIQAAG